MSWLAQLHGDLSHLHPDAAREEEDRIASALHEVAGTLVDGGSNGVSATFTGQHVGTRNILDPAQPPAEASTEPEGQVADGTPAPPPAGPPPTFTDNAPDTGASRVAGEQQAGEPAGDGTPQDQAPAEAPAEAPPGS